MAIQYVIGDATKPVGEWARIIVHCCNDAGKWGAGFVLALSKRWPASKEEYLKWFKGKIAVPFELGQVQFVVVEENLWVANLVGQHGVRGLKLNPPIRYDAVREGLVRVAEFAKEQAATLHMPRMGSGLAGGKWEEISKIIDEELITKGISVTVYDLKCNSSGQRRGQDRLTTKSFKESE